MVTRSSFPTLPPIDVARLRPHVRRTGWSLLASVPDSRAAWKLAIWRLLFLPFWAWSDLPRPQLPERNIPLPPGGLAGEHVKSRFQSIARRTWLQRSLAIVARTFVLTILFAAAWQFVELLGGPPVRFEVVPYVGLALLVPALVLIVCSRPSHAQTARMLDRSFHLQERMVTALANIGQDLPPGKGQAAGLRYLQVADAANALTAIRNNPAFRVMPPVRELVLGIIFALVLASLFFLRGGDGQVAPLEAARVPEFIPAAQQYVAGPETELQASPLGEEALSDQQLQELQQQSNTIRQDLMTLAEALEDHALTRSAAEAITQGDYQQAAQDLREVAEQIDGLNQSESESLASDLEQASAAMAGSEGLSGASQDAANGLREGGAAAQEGMQGVADAVESSSSQMASNDSMSQGAAQEPQSSSGESAPQESQASSDQESLFDNQSMGQEGSASAAGDSQQSQNSEPSDQQSEAASDSNSEGGEGAGQEGGESASEGAENSNESGSDAQSPSEEVAAGGESLAGDSASADPPTGSGAGQETSTGGGAGEKTSGDQAADSGATGAEEGEELPEPSESDVSESEGNGEGAGGAGDEEVTPGGTLMLNRAPQGQSVPVQGSGSQSNLGSGGGVTTAGGSSTQGSVSESGPDSNHVPPEYRSIVESYFSSGNE